MTPDEVYARVATINTADDEGAHYDEDHLRQDVLKAIADGAEDPAGLARAALSTKDLLFARWYA